MTKTFFNKTSSPDWYWDGVPEELMDEMKKENIWYCEKDGATGIGMEAPICGWCDSLMIEIGWIEQHDNEDM